MIAISWTPSATLSNPSIINPKCNTCNYHNYQVIARIGSCTATDDVKVIPVPYPVANAGADTMICYILLLN